MDTKLLEDALILLEQKSFTGAAERRNITQPAFSRRIQALERWAGRSLLERNSNRIELSEGLIQSEPQIRRLLAQLKQLQKQLQQPTPAFHSIIMAAPHSLSASTISEIIEQTNTTDMERKVRLLTGNQDEALSIFLRHDADVLVSYEHRSLNQLPFDNSVLKIVWRLDALVPAVSKKMCHLLDEYGSLPDDVATISYPANSMFEKIISSHQFNKTKKLSPQGVVESAFSVGVANLMKAGHGAAWVPKSLIKSEILNEDVKILSSNYGQIPMEIVLYVHKANSNAANFVKPLTQASA
ncbi:LysR family transcriptional regulator [Paracoccaceae bacterium]|jgi:DNA-binding transcriptional LysR family regulator|nr:LysR family transcriptional regulator [Paracoccaceae bacterium]